jgi:membrane protease YdiL (CAAX protease family)
MSKVKARSGLGIFFVVLVAGSAYFEHRILVLGGSIQHHLGLIAGLIWWVTVSSIVARLALREGIRDVSFRWGGAAGTRAFAVAAAMPLFVGFAAYGIAWSTGLASFKAPALPAAILGMHFASAEGASMRFFQCLGAMLTLGALQACKYTAGEEIGWRGYMLTRLIDAKIPAPILVSGLVWGLWHAPLIVSGQYASGPHPLLSVGLFVVGIVAGGYVFAWLRLSSGSIWPCIWGHGAWNAIIQGAFDKSTADTSMWVGESGVLTAGMLVLFAVVLYKLWPVTDHLQKASPAPSPAT